MAKFIYGLICPVSKAISYIGVSANPDKRFEEHLKDPADTAKTRWLRSLQELGLLPTMTVLAVVDDAEAFAQEERWIAFGLSVSWPLKNETLPNRQRFQFSFELPTAQSESALETYDRYAIPAYIANKHSRRMDIEQVWFRAFDGACFCMFYPYYESRYGYHVYGPSQVNFIATKHSKVPRWRVCNWPGIVEARQDNPNQESIYSAGHPVFGFNDPVALESANGNNRLIAFLKRWW